MTSGHQQHQQHAHGHGHAHGAGGEDGALAELLDLDAEVLADYLSEVTGWVAGHAGPRMSGRILDLGCGTGAGTFALLRRAEGAEVVAVDGSGAMLERLREKAHRLGVGERVRTVQADLDEAWPDFGAVDVVWTSAFMHHLADPDRALGELFGLLRPGGLLAVVEMDGFPRFLPEDLGPGLGRPGLEERCHAALADRNAERMPHLGDDWGVRLSGAGFVVQEERPFKVELGSPVPDVAKRYAQASLSRLGGRVAEQLSSEDQAVLDAILDTERPESLLRREDLCVRASRIAWAARRP